MISFKFVIYSVYLFLERAKARDLDSFSIMLLVLILPLLNLTSLIILMSYFLLDDWLFNVVMSMTLLISIGTTVLLVFSVYFLSWFKFLSNYVDSCVIIHDHRSERMEIRIVRVMFVYIILSFVTCYSLIWFGMESISLDDGQYFKIPD